MPDRRTYKFSRNFVTVVLIQTETRYVDMHLGTRRNSYLEQKGEVVPKVLLGIPERKHMCAEPLAQGAPLSSKNSCLAARMCSHPGSVSNEMA